MDMQNALIQLTYTVRPNKVKIEVCELEFSHGVSVNLITGNVSSQFCIHAFIFAN